MKGQTLKVSGPAVEAVASDGGVTLNIPIALRWRNGRRVVVSQSSAFDSESRTRTDATPLQLALALGPRWLSVLEVGDVPSMGEIARHERTDHGYVVRHINLTQLAPEIVAAILDEELPDRVRPYALSINPPAWWETQRRSLNA